MSILSTKQKMGAAALIMGLSILISRFMGLLRDKVISWQFGASGETDMYFAAFVIPDFLNYLLAGGYASITLIPLLSKLFDTDEKDAWKLFGTIFTWASISIIALSAIAWIYASPLAKLVAPGFDAYQIERLTSYLRIILPAQVFFLPGACLSAILYIRKQFAVPALMPLIYNGCILIFGVSLPMLGIVQGMEGFCYGVLIGSFLGAFLLPLITVQNGGMKWNFSLHHPQLKTFILIALPLMLGQSVVMLDEQFVRIFGSMAGEGAVSLLSYARRIMMVPVGVIAQAAAVASFPFLATLLAKNDMEAFNQNLNSALRNTMTLALPIVFYMIIVAKPTMSFIFEGGSFTIEDSAKATPLLQLMLLAVPFWVLQQIIGRAFYAIQDTLRPALIGTCVTALTLPFYFILSPKLGAFGVAIMTTTSITLYAIVLQIFAIKHFGKTFFTGLLRVCVKSFAICIIPSLSAYLCVQYLPQFFFNHLPIARVLQQFLILASSGLLFLLAYLILARLYAKEMYNLVLYPILKRVKKEV